MRLEKDSNTISSQTIKVDTGAVANSDHLIVKVRVVGDNGVISDGEVFFTLDHTNPLEHNKRIPIGIIDNGTNNPTIGPPVLTYNQGSFFGIIDNVPLPTLSGFASAHLEDENGVTIDPNTAASGKLVIKTNNDDYRLVMQEGDFSSTFGFNDLLTFNNATSQWDVSEQILSDPNQLALGRVSKDTEAEAAERKALIGKDNAQATLQFGAAAPGVGDTVTIDDEVFIFAAAPTSPNEVQTDAALNNSVANLLAAIQNHPRLQTKITAESDGNDTIKIIAKTPGTWANTDGSAPINIGFDNTISGNANTINLNASGPQTANVLSAPALSGGTNQESTTKFFNFTIGSDSKQIAAELAALTDLDIVFEEAGSASAVTITLGGLASHVSSSLAQESNTAKTSSEVATKVLEGINIRVNELLRADEPEQYRLFLDVINYMRANSVVVHKIQALNKELLDILFRG